MWCDVTAFDEALASGHAGEALELYGGHLWDGSDLSDCPAFDGPGNGLLTTRPWFGLC